MATKLDLYQQALELLGERPLASLAEDREPRRALDAVYDTTLDYCLEQGFWNFAMRSVELEYSPSIEPLFSLPYAFEKPTDWVRTYVVSANETFSPPINEYLDEAGYWFADADTLYVRYVSNSIDYGMAIAQWPESFSRYVATRLAARICKRITNDTSQYEILFKLESRAKLDAMSKDAINEGPARMPFGTWTQSRLNGNNRSRWNERFR